MSVETILNAVGIFMGKAAVWVTDVADLVINEPLLLIMVVAVPLVGLGVGLLRRLINVN